MLIFPSARFDYSTSLLMLFYHLLMATSSPPPPHSGISSQAEGLGLQISSHLWIAASWKENESLHAESISYLFYLLLGHLLPQLVHVLQLLLCKAKPKAFFPHVGDQGDEGEGDQALLR